MTISDLKQKVDFLLESKIVSLDESVIFFSSGEGQIKKCVGFIEGVTVPSVILDRGGIFDYIELGFGHLEG